MPSTRVYWLHTLTPTHVGIGRGVGYIDLPIDREAVTGWPVIRGSAFKGVWADRFRATEIKRKSDAGLRAAFGVAGDDNTSNAGALVPTDARLVCLPVRSFRGTFAWCTSALALQFLRRTLELAGLGTLPAVLTASPAEADDTDTPAQAFCTEGTALSEDDRIYLEDLDFAAVASAEATAWAEWLGERVFAAEPAWKSEFIKRFVVVPDPVFDFLAETGTEVQTRVKISDDTKTVDSRALWTEEALPAETILAGLILCDRVFAKDGTDQTPEGLLDKFAREPLTLQIGGKATVGRGQVRCVFTPVTGGAS